MRKISALFIIFTLLILGPPGEAAATIKKKQRPYNFKKSLQTNGSLRLGYFQNDRSYQAEENFVVTSAWLNLKLKTPLGIGVVFNGNLQTSDTTRRLNSVGDLREAYTFGSLKKFELKLGRQIIVWGRADKFNPTDTLSFKDLTRLVVDDEDQRTGIFTAQETYTFDENRIILIWQPEWRDPHLPIPPLPAGVYLSTDKPESPESQFALKFDRSATSVDFSLSYFDGYDKNPDFRLTSLAPINLALHYNKVRVYGADTAFTIGEYSLRSELAFTQTSDSKNDPLQKNSFLYVVTGFDKNIFESSNINVQYLFRQIQDWQDTDQIANPTSRLLAKKIETLFNQQSEQQHGLTIRLLQNFLDQTLTTDLSALLWFEKMDSVLRLKVTYSINDNLKTLIGADLFSGPDDSYLGQSKKLSTVYTELRYSF